VRTAYRCRAYPDAAQQAVLNRTFGCVRVVWNTILAAREERYITERMGTSYGQASAALTALKQDPQRAPARGHGAQPRPDRGGADMIKPMVFQRAGDTI
jgi:transposase